MKKYNPAEVWMVLVFLVMLIAYILMIAGCQRPDIIIEQPSNPARPVIPVPVQPTYIGCYTDTSTRALPVFLLQNDATVESCIALAKAYGYKYAGVQYGIQCFAGNALGYAIAPPGSCNMPCQADPAEICGGVWANSIYSTGL